MTRSVLVLGSHGQIGAPLCRHLADAGHRVTRFDLRMGPAYDLRLPANPELLRLLDQQDYVFFLAFDVGGAPYLAERGRSAEFLQGNVALMSHTFEALGRSGVPFAFASSQMSQLPNTPYGSLKAVGEHFTRALDGTAVRLRNVYGVEVDRQRSHVITDFIHMAQERGVVQMRTDGSEVRDFLHADDCARGLTEVMDRYPVQGAVEPIGMATGRWTPIRQVAEIVATRLGAAVVEGSGRDPFAGADLAAPANVGLPGWSPRIALEEGIGHVVDQISAG